MSVSRRRLVQTLAAGTVGPAAAVAAAQDTPLLDPLRQLAAAHGVALTDERLRILQPVLERRKRQLQTLRDFAVDDSVAPTTRLPR